MILDRWKYLYHLVIEIAKLEPWNRYWDGDFFVIKTDTKDEPYYITIMGRNGQCKAIGVYYGQRGLYDLFRASTDRFPYVSSSYLMGITDGVCCYYESDRDQVPYENMEIIDKCGFDFDDGEYIYFVEFLKGYFPSFISEDNLEDIINVYEGLLYCLNYMLENNFEPDFDDNEIMYCSRDKHCNWKIAVIDKPYPDNDIYDCDVRLSESEVEKLAQLDENNRELAVDMDYLFVPCDNNFGLGNGKEFNLLALVFYDLTNDQLLDMAYVLPFENELEKLLDNLVGIFEKHGLYSSIVARNPYVLNTLFPLCEALDIELFEGEVDYIDDIYDDIRNMSNEHEKLMS